MKRWVLILGSILVLASFIVGFTTAQRRKQVKEKLIYVKTYDDCEKAEGSMVQESYPPVCITADKRTFIENIGNELDFKDLILIDNPRPNTTIASPLVVKGKARGSWFFEACFPVELFDDKGKSLAKVSAKAESDWMTNDFVPFTATIPFERPITKRGLLIIKNANASGEKKNEKQVIMPVKF